MTNTPRYEVFDRVCNDNGNCGYVQYLYGDGSALIQFDDPGCGPDTWRLHDLYPEDDDDATEVPGRQCETTADPSDPEDDWHIKRVCEYCGQEWWGLHCQCDGHQTPCPHCGKAPTRKSCPQESQP